MKRESKKMTKKEATANLSLVTDWLEYLVSKIKNGDLIGDHDLGTAERVVRAYGIRGTHWLDVERYEK